MIEKSSKDKILIIAFPSEGLVGVFATSYIVNQMKMNNVSELEFFEISILFNKRWGSSRAVKFTIVTTFTIF